MTDAQTHLNDPRWDEEKKEREEKETDDSDHE